MAGNDSTVSTDSVAQSYRALWELMIPEDDTRARRELDKLTTGQLVELDSGLRRIIGLIQGVVRRREA